MGQVDHFSIHGQDPRAWLCCECVDDGAGVCHVLVRGREGGVDHGHLRRMNGKLSGESFAGRNFGLFDRALPLEVVLGTALDNLEKLCPNVMPTVGGDGRLGWDSSARGLDNRGHEKVEVVHDARFFYLAMPDNKRAVQEHIERTLHQRYAGVKNTATETQKRAALEKPYYAFYLPLARS